MKAKITNLNRLNTEKEDFSDREVSSAAVKHWWQKLGYCSIFAAVPAMVAHVPEVSSDERKKPEPGVAEQKANLRHKLNVKYTKPAFLKHQSEFLLPHQRHGFNSLAPIAGSDDCPGRLIPAGTYTAAVPYLDLGDTTGANDTVSHVYYINYPSYDYNALAPDHVYTFTLTSLGSNPRIEVTTTSGTYKPMIYILKGGTAGGCPAGTANHAFNELLVSDSRWPGGDAMLGSFEMNLLPLNVPLHLFVDSALNDANGSGSYRLRMQDVTIAPAVSNAIDFPEFFVRQHYLDFLSREPEQSGMDAWLRVLRNCPAGDNECLHQARLTTSAAFLGSSEFQLKGYFVFRFYKVAFGRLPAVQEIISDMESISRPSPAEVYAAKATFTNHFVQRFESLNIFSGMSNADYVAALLGRYGLSTITAPDPAQPDGTLKVTLTRAELIARLNAGSLTRAQVLRAIADSDQVFQLEFNSAFVAMQYYGYLRRTPEVVGYNAWLNYLNAHPEDFREMVRGFVDSIEYRARFGQP